MSIILVGLIGNYPGILGGLHRLFSLFFGGASQAPYLDILSGVTVQNYG